MARFNKIANPSCATATTGYQSSGTITRITGLSGPPRTTGCSISMGSGSFSAFLRSPLVAASSGQVWSGLVWVRSSASRTVRVDIGTYNSGTFVANNFDINNVSLSANVWTRIRVLGTVTGSFNQIAILLDIPTFGSSGTLSASSYRLEQVNDSLIEYGDGDSGGGWAWDGTTGNSSSTMADAIQPEGLALSVEFGTTTVTPGPVTIEPDGLELTTTFGTSLVSEGLIRPAGLPLTLAFGTTTIIPGPVTISPTGLAVNVGHGTPSLAITIDPSMQRVRSKPPGATYRVMVMARVPQTNGPPTFIEVDPVIGWSRLAYVQELSKPDTMDVTVKVATLPDSIKQRIKPGTPDATELWVYRNGRHIFAGPLIAGPSEGEGGTGDTLTLHAVGLLYYLYWWLIPADITYTNIDQFLIVKALVDQRQALTFGNVGIDTASVTPSGVTRTISFKASEQPWVGREIEKMGRSASGFDVDVDPASRTLQLWYPQQGVDRSSGPDKIAIDRNSISNRNILWSVGAEDVASEFYGIGQAADTSFTSFAENPELLARFGRFSAAASFDTVGSQADVDALTAGGLSARATAFMVPGPNFRVTLDADLAAYGKGDTVDYQLHETLGVGGPFRILKRAVDVEGGKERASVQFV